jgi:hypothetical protein
MLLVPVVVVTAPVVLLVLVALRAPVEGRRVREDLRVQEAAAGRRVRVGPVGRHVRAGPRAQVDTVAPRVRVAHRVPAGLLVPAAPGPVVPVPVAVGDVVLAAVAGPQAEPSGLVRGPTRWKKRTRRNRPSSLRARLPRFWRARCSE